MKLKEWIVLLQNKISSSSSDPRRGIEKLMPPRDPNPPPMPRLNPRPPKDLDEIELLELKLLKAKFRRYGWHMFPSAEGRSQPQSTTEDSRH